MINCIPNMAFQDCSSLKLVNIETDVSTIKDHAFGVTVTSICEKAVLHCSYHWNQLWCVTTIGLYTFDGY